MIILNLLGYVYIIGAVVLLFGAAIFVHEFGHFWMARKRGLKVEGFSIGFGPKIFGWTRDGIEYSWRWIPAGGFVKLPQMMTSEALEGESGTPHEKLPAVSPWSRILVAIAGPIMNLLFAFAIATLLYFIGLPVIVNPPYIGFVDPNSAEGKMGIEEGDLVVSVAGRPVDSWEAVQAITVLSPTNVMPVMIRRGKTEKEYKLTATTSEVIDLKVFNLDPRDHPLITLVLPESAAEAAGAKADDEIVSVDNIPVTGEQQFIRLIRERATKKTALVVKRDNKKIALSVTPRADPSTKKGAIGVQVGTKSTIEYQVQRPGPTPWTQVSGVFEMVTRTFGALLHSKQTGVGPKQLSGPVGIIAILASYVKTDFRLALSFLVMLNVNLFMINLLPLPVLDGGHILMSLIEAIRRRPVSVKFMEWTTTAFAVMLISFMLYVTFFDLKRMPLFRALFSRETRIQQQGAPADTAAPTTPPAPAKNP